MTKPIGGKTKKNIIYLSAAKFANSETSIKEHVAVKTWLHSISIKNS